MSEDRCHAVPALVPCLACGTPTRPVHPERRLCPTCLEEYLASHEGQRALRGASPGLQFADWLRERRAR